MYRLFGAILGFFVYGFRGAIFGFIIGGIIERFTGGNKRQNPMFRAQTRTVNNADFELNLLSLASIVIKADGKVSQSELDFVRQYFVQSYGKDRANITFKTFNDVIKKQNISAQSICAKLKLRMQYESRLQMLHFLFSIAKADGHVSEAEVKEINTISGYLGINYRDFESIKAMFFNNPDSAYKILEIEKTATDSEIKKAYRTMVKKYHPDKLEHMDDVYKKGAEEKFRKVQEAYEQLQNERGF